MLGPFRNLPISESAGATMDEARRLAVNFVRSLTGSIFILLGKPQLAKHTITFVFHEVSDDPRLHAKETRTFSSLKTFESQIRWIQESFRVRNLKEVKDDVRGRKCIVSFDDGYAGVSRYALPLLEKARMPFICFINMATINGEVNSSALAMYIARIQGRHVNWRDSNPAFYKEALESLSAERRNDVEAYQGPYMTEVELESLSRNPRVTIGDHLYNHWLVDELSKVELENELERSQKELRKYVSYGAYFAAPHGCASQRALDVLQEHSFRYVFSGNVSQIRGGMSVFPRVDLNDEIASRQQFFGAIAISLLRPHLQRMKI